MIIWCVFFTLISTTYAVDKSNIFFYYYNQTGGFDTILYNVSANDEICSWFNTSKKTVVYVHGWYNETNRDAAINESFYPRKAILSLYDVNLFSVDYPYYELYSSAVYYQPIIGKYVGEYINYIATNCSYSLANFTIIGHSLGAHISGVAGKTTGGEVAAIIGMDPAGPLYLPINTTRLMDTDARYVGVIHTNAGEFGYAYSCGDSDFYVNGGSIQPFCTDALDYFCSHRSSVKFYANSVLNSTLYKGYQCTLAEYTAGLCKTLSTSSAYMGGYGPDTSASGDFYFSASTV